MNTLRTFLFALVTVGFLAPAHSADLWDVYQLALKNDPTFARLRPTMKQRWRTNPSRERVTCQP